MPVTIRQKQWDVDGDGIACLIAPGIPAQTVELVPSARMDSEIARQVAYRDQIAAHLAVVQAELDTANVIVTNMTALRATVTAEPPA